ncbi:MAG: sel1 repeat family protein [Deltaproteobacteria bacterium]|jgi:TPR repeat protein|nr:sel1 repeat family protein [Deltaproteobacteria bacterium]
MLNKTENPEQLFEMGKKFYFPASDGISDYELAFHYFYRAARLGHAPSQRLLGISFLEGTICAKDLEKAKFWLTLACENGDPQAAFSLALMSATGEGVPKRWDTAYCLLSRPEVRVLPEARELKRKLKKELMDLYPQISKTLEREERILRSAFTHSQERFIPFFWTASREDDDQKDFLTLLDLNLGKITQEEAFKTLNQTLHTFYLEIHARLNPCP